MYKKIKIEEPALEDEDYIYVTEYELTSKQFFLLSVPTAVLCVFIAVLFLLGGVCSNEWMVGLANNSSILTSGIFGGCLQNSLDKDCLSNYVFNGYSIPLLKKVSKPLKRQ